MKLVSKRKTLETLIVAGIGLVAMLFIFNCLVLRGTGLDGIRSSALTALYVLVAYYLPGALIVYGTVCVIRGIQIELKHAKYQRLRKRRAN